MERYIDADRARDNSTDPYVRIYLDSQPTADVAPVIYAHWEKTGWKKSGGEVEYKCSHCKRCKVWKKKTQKLPQYCEKCGANMDKEKEKWNGTSTY